MSEVRIYINYVSWTWWCLIAFRYKLQIPDYVATVVLPKLIHKTESIDLNVRHGAILAIGESIYALSRVKLSNGTNFFSSTWHVCWVTIYIYINIIINQPFFNLFQSDLKYALKYIWLYGYLCIMFSVREGKLGYEATYYMYVYIYILFWSSIF